MTKRDERDTDPPKRPSSGNPKSKGQGSKSLKRATAIEETDRLTNLAAALGAGAGLVPIPGSGIALTGMEILLIGAVAKIWDHPLTEGFLLGFVKSFVGRFGVVMGAALMSDLVGWVPGFGTVVKSAAHAGCFKYIGSSMRDHFRVIYGDDREAKITAEEARNELEKAAARLAVYGPDLTDGFKKAIQGDAKKLSKTFSKIFASDEEDA